MSGTTTPLRLVPWYRYSGTIEAIFSFGLQPLSSEARLALLTLLEDRYEEKSVIITSQLPLDRWYDYISEPTLADAIMDRLINSSEHIQLKGDTLRSRNRRKKRDD